MFHSTRFISTERGAIKAILHFPSTFKPQVSESVTNAVVMVGGVGGGVHGPSDSYPKIAQQLSSDPKVNALCARVDYRDSYDLWECVYDVCEVINFLEKQYEVKNVITIGWSLGGAAVLQCAAKVKSVRGVITIATQSYGATGPVQKLTKRRTALLLIHGTDDKVLSDFCSRQLFALARDNPNKKLQLYERDNHLIEKNADNMIHLITEWCKEVFNSLPQTAEE